jgi:hypothetical protein
VSGRKPLVAVWRDAVCDSGLDRTAKLVALSLSTFMNGSGAAYPSRATIGRRASLSDRGVDGALDRLEAAGFLAIERSRGRTSHRYGATLPVTANAVRRSEWATANEVPGSEDATANLGTLNSEPDAPNSERRSPESVESEEESGFAVLKEAVERKQAELRASREAREAST